MKYLGILSLLMVALTAHALELSPEGRREADLFNTFLEAVYVHQNNAPRAYTTLQKALAMDPESKYLRRVLVSAALAMQKPELADPYANYVEQGENEAEDFAVFGAYQLQKGQPQEALKAYEKAFALAPENTDLLYQYLLLLSMVDFDKTIEVLEKTAREQPSFASQSYAQIGSLYKRRSQLDKALSYFDKAIQSDPNDPAPRLAKGEIYEKTGQYFLMLHEFEELEKMGYANAGTFTRMAAMFLVVKDVPKAKEYFLKAKAHTPGDTAANYFLSLFAQEEGNYTQAIKYLKEADDYATNASRWLEVSFLERKLNQPQASLRTLAQAYDQFKDNVEIAFFYGLALNDAKQYKYAARVFDKILQARPDYVDARLHDAYALESLKKYKDMEKQIKLILDVQPQNAAALNLLAYSLAERETRLSEAQELVTRALAVSPNDASFADTLGWIYVKQGNLAAAETVFTAIPVEVIRQNPEIAYHLGVLRYEQGRPQEALPYLEMSRNTWPAAEKLYQQLTK